MAKKLGFTGIIFLILYSVITWSVIADHRWIQRFDYALIVLIQDQITESVAGSVSVATDIAGSPVVFILTFDVVLTLINKRMHLADIWFGLNIYIFASFFMDTKKPVIGREGPDLLVIPMDSSMSC